MQLTLHLLRTKRNIHSGGREWRYETNNSVNLAFPEAEQKNQNPTATFTSDKPIEDRLQ